MALLICACSVTLVASDLSDAKRNLKSAQRELTSVTHKRDRAQKKQEKLLEDYEKVLAKMAANQDKPKSLAYKDAFKKSEALPEKLEQNAQLLASLNRQVDSLQNIVSQSESALSELQEESIEESTDFEAIEEEKEEEEPNMASNIDPVQLLVEKEDYDDVTKFPDDESGVASSSLEEETPSSSEPTTFWGKVWKVIKTIFWIFVGIIVLGILMNIGGHTSSSSSSSSRSSSSSSSSSSGSQSKQDYKRQRIAEKQAAIARQQEKIERLKDSIAGRKHDKIPYSDLEHSISSCRQRIASLRGDIARIKAGKL